MSTVKQGKSGLRGQSGQIEIKLEIPLFPTVEHVLRTDNRWFKKSTATSTSLRDVHFSLSEITGQANAVDGVKNILNFNVGIYNNI